MARTISGDDPTATAPYKDVDGDVHLNGTTVYVEAATLDFAEGVISNVIVQKAISVTIPSFASDTCDSVAVDVASAFTASVAVGDIVIAAPAESLPSNCVFTGAYVSATDTITCTFASAEGAGVTGAAKTFNFVVIKTAESA